MDSEMESKFVPLITQLVSAVDDEDSDSYESTVISFITEIITLVSSIDLDSQPEPESELMSLTSQTISYFKSMDLDSQPKLLREFIPLISQKISHLNSADSSLEPDFDLKLSSLVNEAFQLKPQPELISLIRQIFSLIITDSDSDPEPEPEPEPWLETELESLKSLVSQLMSRNRFVKKPLSRGRDTRELEWDSLTRLVTQLMSLFSSMNLDSQPKPESELMSLTKQVISHFNSMDSDSQQRLILFITKKLYPYEYTSGSMNLEIESDLTSLILQIFSLAISMDSEWRYLILVCPQEQVRVVEGKFHVTKEKYFRWSTTKWACLPLNWEKISLAGRYRDTHFLCQGCNGQNHKEYEKAPVEISHLLHPKHPLQLVLYPESEDTDNTMQCYCCDEDLHRIFYCCLACGYAMNTDCAEKTPSLSIDYPKWHEHPLALFPRQTSLTCSLCALTHSSCPFYMCPPCDFVVHQSCLQLPRVIRISRHPHRIAFTFSFNQGARDRSCGVCRTKIDNNNGGYSCIKEGCSYEAHSKCATQSNVWDGKELENVPEEIEEEELGPFVRISDGIILHFLHQHQLRLDTDTGRDYNENKQCQACFMPIYFGNLYSCMQCDYILHQKCAELSRKIHHPIHPHLLTLVRGYNGAKEDYTESCSGCDELCIAEFFYNCSETGCDFQLHVPCATISEPLIHENHMHPLYLTSKPGERRRCSACNNVQRCATEETFNCIACDFCLCFGCATLPQKVRYRHDKHVLSLRFVKEEIRTMTYWCEVCEEKIEPKERLYICDEYCCVTLHVKCMLGEDLYMKPASVWNYFSQITDVLPNNHMSRPICSNCKKRCPNKTVIKYDGLIFCRQDCFRDYSFWH
ncbi:uncharacterized protein LOC17892023 [Capsella rubella]|uniref:uncharacterized protein LOC17892023 n=1 Tax=Capsella rubella TaxID=81985 RepID=UPI000CD53EBC|nr:uncharacterized protein LOC17892023 [Capsella rubella]